MLGLNLVFIKLATLLSLADAQVTYCSLKNQTQLFFLIPPWWEYLKGSPDGLGQCAPYFQFPNDILPVGLAVLDMLLRLAGFLAVVSIIIAGVEYITAAGNAEKITNARRRWINALSGLAIALVATAVVSFLGRNLIH